MKYLRIISAQTRPAGQYGLIRGDSIHLIETSPLLGPIKETGTVFPLDDVREFLAPVEPPNIIGVALNYHDSLRESGTEPPSEPVAFLKPNDRMEVEIAGIGVLVNPVVAEKHRAE
jgi:2-keto-4-pentenoate hydratase/2-oxohepta-3-ene-1,7-dioic acid hydratase in catechol pathway